MTDNAASCCSALERIPALNRFSSRKLALECAVGQPPLHNLKQHQIRLLAFHRLRIEIVVRDETASSVLLLAGANRNRNAGSVNRSGFIVAQAWPPAAR
jgi:hypothetical protein